MKKLFNILLDVFFLFIIGIIGWYLFEVINIPVPTLLGAMSMVIISIIIQIPLPPFPSFLLPILQIIFGLYIGSKFTKNTFKELGTFIYPVVIVVVWALLSAIGLGVVLSKVINTDIQTAILCAAPGGVTEAGFIALAIGADVTTVVFFQIFRVFTTLLIISLLFSRKTVTSSKEDLNLDNNQNRLKQISLRLKKPILDLNLSKMHFGGLKNYLPGLTLATIGGCIGIIIGLPAGSLFGSMILIIFVSALGKKVVTPPLVFKKLMEIGIGIGIGYNFNPEVSKITSLYLPASLLLVVLLGGSLFIAYIIRRLVKWDFITTILATAPGGLTAMTILASSLEKDAIKVSVLQLARFLTIKILILSLVLLI